jgi:hypothetical protein
VPVGEEDGTEGAEGTDGALSGERCV